MPRLPRNIVFDEAAFPHLQDIFHDIDSAIAAIIASEPAFRVQRLTNRRSRSAGTAVGVASRPRRSSRAAAA